MSSLSAFPCYQLIILVLVTLFFGYYATKMAGNYVLHHMPCIYGTAFRLLSSYISVCILSILALNIHNVSVSIKACWNVWYSGLPGILDVSHSIGESKIYDEQCFNLMMSTRIQFLLLLFFGGCKQ